MIKKIKDLSESYFGEILDIRRHLHMYPELSFQEFETSKYIKDILNLWGINFIDGYVETGILVVLEGKNPNLKSLALRADFDALPINEKNRVEYCSKNEGVMHACGHDAHTACLLGALKILHSSRDLWNGTIKFIFQPAEERLPGGAKQMIAEGVLENPIVTNVIAQHVLPDLEVGKVGFRSGIYMASTDELYINIKGIGGHAAIPSQYNNPILASSNLILRLTEFFTSHKDSIFAIGYFKADGSTNVIPDQVKLMGTFRALSEEYRKQSHINMKSIVRDVEKEYNVKIELDIKQGYPALYNDEEFTKKQISSAREYLGKENVIDLPIRMTAEDFSYFANAVPSCFYRLGTGNRKKGIVHGLHTSRFDIDEESLKIGMGMIAYLAISS